MLPKQKQKVKVPEIKLGKFKEIFTKNKKGVFIKDEWV